MNRPSLRYSGAYPAASEQTSFVQAGNARLRTRTSARLTGRNLVWGQLLRERATLAKGVARHLEPFQVPESFGLRAPVHAKPKHQAPIKRGRAAISARMKMADEMGSEGR